MIESLVGPALIYVSYKKLVRIFPLIIAEPRIISLTLLVEKYEMIISF